MMLSDCTSILWGSRPYSQDSIEGVRIALAKRAVIGLVAAVCIATAIYFLNMASYETWNPYNFTLTTQMNIGIATAALFGTVVLGLTACWMCSIPSSKN